MSTPASAGQHVYRAKPMSRPGQGRVGTAVDIEANFVRLAIPSSRKVSQYAVQLFRSKNEKGVNVKKEVSTTERISFNRSCFDVLLKTYAQEFGCKLAYNGRSIAYAPTEINRTALGHAYKIEVNSDGQRAAGSDKGTEEVEIVLTHARYLDFCDLSSGEAQTTAAAEFTTCLDVVLGQAAAVGHVQVGRSFYNSDNTVPLGRRNVIKSAWTGFYQSVRLSQLGLLVNMDESATAFWNQGRKPLAQLVRDANDRRGLSCAHPRSLQQVARKLKGLKVKAIHTGIVYRLYGFSNRGADRITFESEGYQVSITEYLANTYGITLENGEAPCVKTHPTRDTFLPMECLSVVPNQRVEGLLSQDETITIVRAACTKPCIRRNNAIRKIQQLKHHQHPTCRDFGVRVHSDLVKLKARVLPPPSIQYRQGITVPNNGEWRAKNGVMNPSNVLSWAVCSMVQIGEVEIEQFINDLIAAMERAGLKRYMKYPKFYHCDARRIEQKMEAISHEFSNDRTLSMKQPCLQLLIIIKDSQDSKVYNAIKRKGDLQLGIATQVCLSKHCRFGARGRNMYCDNLVLKINAKLGGQNGHVTGYNRDKSNDMADVDFLNVPHIILGGDVTHPAPGEKGPSIAALVGSRDRHGLQFASSIRSQEGRQEMMIHMGEMFKEVYAVWYRNFGGKFHAAKIIMFRDGVSESQFEEVMQREVSAIRNVCMQISNRLRPRITYVIVTKRHHTRLFPTAKPVSDRSGNVLPGTVVDSDITSEEYYDFYLNSHVGVQGTNRPSKYTVLVDENAISPDALYGYIYRLSHSFARCNRSVSMVHSAYYAHLLAFRARAYMQGAQSDTDSQSSSGSVLPSAPRAHELLRGHLYFV
ncbi:Protein argonaute 3 [Gracilaria domingensis]|nr:Protein argonaute 3 [Gracilaria domingensis]